jgi:hypothetical protein
MPSRAKRLLCLLRCADRAGTSLVANFGERSPINSGVHHQVTHRTFAGRARELAEGHVHLELIIESLLRGRETLLTELRKIEKTLLEARHDPVTRMLMTTLGVGAIVQG